MRISPQRPSGRRRHLVMCMTALVLTVPAMAAAQYGAPELEPGVPAEQYHVEFAGTIWNPNLSGIISSERLGVIGSSVDFVEDLGFEQTSFADMRIVLRPSKKSRFRIQYTPIEYKAETTLKRDLLFNGQKFPLSLPLQSQLDWKVWRFGYEYDFIYRERGFIGVLLEGRYTQMTAELASPLMSESTKVSAPLPAIGIVGRVYPIPEVAVNFEVTTFRVPEDTIPDVEANYYDWDIYGTINVHPKVGLQVGFRRMTNFLVIKNDSADVKFQGLWFGGALRY
jgi:hypothetical protein